MTMIAVKMTMMIMMMAMEIMRTMRLMMLYLSLGWQNYFDGHEQTVSSVHAHVLYYYFSAQALCPSSAQASRLKLLGSSFSAQASQASGLKLCVHRQLKHLGSSFVSIVSSNISAQAL